MWFSSFLFVFFSLHARDAYVYLYKLKNSGCLLFTTLYIAFLADFLQLSPRP